MSENKKVNGLCELLIVLLSCCTVSLSAQGTVLHVYNQTLGDTPLVVTLNSTVASLTLTNVSSTSSLIVNISDWEPSNPVAQESLPVTLSLMDIPRIRIISTAPQQNCSSSLAVVRSLQLSITGGSTFNVSLEHLILCNSASVTVESSSNATIAISSLYADFKSTIRLSQLSSRSVVQLLMPLTLSRGSNLWVTQCQAVSVFWTAAGTLTLSNQSSIVVHHNTLVAHRERRDGGPYFASGVSGNIMQWLTVGDVSLVTAVITQNSSLRIENNKCDYAPCSVRLMLYSLSCRSSAFCIVLSGNSLDARGAVSQLELYRSVYVPLTIEVATSVSVSGGSWIILESNILRHEYSGLRIAVTGAMSLVGNSRDGGASFVCSNNIITTHGASYGVDPAVLNEASGAAMLDISFYGTFTARSDNSSANTGVDCCCDGAGALMLIESNRVQTVAGAAGPWSAMLRVNYHLGAVIAFGQCTTLSVRDNSVKTAPSSSLSTNFSSLTAVGWTFAGTSVSISDGASLQMVDNSVTVMAIYTWSTSLTTLYGVALIMTTQRSNIFVVRRSTMNISQNQVVLAGGGRCCNRFANVILSLTASGSVVVSSAAVMLVDGNTANHPRGFFPCGPRAVTTSAFCGGVVVQYCQQIELGDNSTLSVSRNTVYPGGTFTASIPMRDLVSTTVSSGSSASSTASVSSGSSVSSTFSMSFMKATNAPLSGTRSISSAVSMSQSTSHTLSRIFAARGKSQSMSPSITGWSNSSVASATRTNTILGAPSPVITSTAGLFAGVALMSGCVQGTPVSTLVYNSGSTLIMQFNNVTLVSEDFNTVGIFALGWTSVISVNSLLRIVSNKISVTMSTTLSSASTLVVVSGVVLQSIISTSSSSSAFSLTLSWSFLNVIHNTLEVTASSSPTSGAALKVYGMAWFSSWLQIGYGSWVLVASNMCVVLRNGGPSQNTKALVGIGVYAYSPQSSSIHSSLLVFESSQFIIDGNTVVLDSGGTAGVLLDVASNAGCTQTAPAALAVVNESAVSVSFNTLIRTTNTYSRAIVDHGIVINVSSAQCTAMALWRTSRLLVQSNMVKLPSTTVSNSEVYLGFISSFYVVLDAAVIKASLGLGDVSAAAVATNAMSVAAAVLTLSSSIVVTDNQFLSATLFSENAIEFYFSTGYTPSLTLRPVSLLLCQHSRLVISNNQIGFALLNRHGILVSMNFPILTPIGAVSNTAPVVVAGVTAWDHSELMISQNVVSSSSYGFIAGLRVYFDMIPPVCYNHSFTICPVSPSNCTVNNTVRCDSPAATLLFDVYSVFAIEGNLIAAGTGGGALLIDRSTGSSMQAVWSSGSELRIAGNTFSCSSYYLGAVDLFRCVPGISNPTCFASTDSYPYYSTPNQDATLQFSSGSVFRIERNGLYGRTTGVWIAVQWGSLSRFLIADNVVSVQPPNTGCFMFPGNWTIGNENTSYWKIWQNRCICQSALIMTGAYVSSNSMPGSVSLQCNSINGVMVPDSASYVSVSIPSAVLACITVCVPQSDVSHFQRKSI